MKRKLFSSMLSAFALLLLMGAGVETDSSAALVIEEESAFASQEVQVLETGIPTGTQTDKSAQGAVEADPAAEAAALATQTGEAIAVTEAAAEPALDHQFLVNGQPVEQGMYRVRMNGVTYVAISPAVRAIDPTAQVTWDRGTKTATIKSANLNMTITEGQQYVVANGRYLYVEAGVQKHGDNMVVPLRILTKALDATLTWDSATDTIMIQRGSGALRSADQFYNQDDLFWLSRIIYAESGNQSMKGKMAVGNVVMNRVASPLFPNTVLGVVSQRNQFTTYAGGKLANRTPNSGSVIAAKLVMDGAVVEESKGALFFDSLVNSWASRNKTYVCTIGGHKFYR